MHRPLTIALLATLSLVSSGGCGKPPLHEVGGTVTLDGKPLAGALVTFISEGTDRAYFLARTDAQGRYRLQAGADGSGAAVGRYVVRVSTAREPDRSAEPGVVAAPERVPARYNVESELRADVTAGSNEIPLDLRSAPAR